MPSSTRIGVSVLWVRLPCAVHPTAFVTRSCTCTNNSAAVTGQPNTESCKVEGASHWRYSCSVLGVPMGAARYSGAA
jgi:hypothetical protein